MTAITYTLCDHTKTHYCDHTVFMFVIIFMHFTAWTLLSSHLFVNHTLLLIHQHLIMSKHVSRNSEVESYHLNCNNVHSSSPQDNKLLRNLNSGQATRQPEKPVVNTNHEEDWDGGESYDISYSDSDISWTPLLDGEDLKGEDDNNSGNSWQEITLKTTNFKIAFIRSTMT